MSLLFETTIVDSIVPKQESLVIIDSKESVANAFKTLIQKNIYSAPVYDAASKDYLGFLDLLDIVTYMVNIFEKQQQLQGKGKENLDFYDLLDQVQEFDMGDAGKVVGLASGTSVNLIPTGSSVKQALGALFRTPGAHRLPIVDGTNLKSVLTQSALLNFIASNLSKLPLSLRQMKIKDTDMALKDVISVRIDTPAIDAFRLMSKHRIHAVAVLDEKGQIFSNLSAKDIRVLEADALFTKLYKSSLEIVQLVRSKNLKAISPSFTVTGDCTIEDAIKKLVVCGVHRLYIEDSAKKPIGVISLGDILNLLSSFAADQSV
jgi:CBS domain-containing protein